MTMNQNLIETIENKYPFPIATEFRRLFTSEYNKPDASRLKQLLWTAEKTVHFLALVVMNDIIECQLRDPFEVPEAFRKDFVAYFTRTTFGKWVGLLRDALVMSREASARLFIPEMIKYIINDDGKESDAKRCFNELTSLRNRLSHDGPSLTTMAIKELNDITEKQLEVILSELSFITEYKLMHVAEVNAIRRRWTNPHFHHNFEKAVGHGNKFFAYWKDSASLLEAPSVILIKENEEEYLGLEPLVIYSVEGENKVPDLFLYADRNENKLLYLPADAGGKLNLLDTSQSGVEDHCRNLDKFFDIFGTRA